MNNKINPNDPAVKVGDKVYHRDWGVYEVHKVSALGIHAFKTINEDRYYIVFHFNPTHHMQTAASELQIINELNKEG